MELPTTAIVDGPVPKHVQLRSVLTEIAQRGETIPSERELMARYNLSRGTVRRAIGSLVEDGLLSRSPGKGTFANRPRLETQLHLASFSQDMRRRGLTPSTRIVSTTSSIPPAEIASTIALSPGELAWRIERIRNANDEPIAHEIGWYPASRLPGLDAHDLRNASLYQIFGAEYGLWIDHAEQTLWGEAAGPALGRLLRAPEDTPLLVFERTSSSQGRPVEHNTSRYRGDRYQLHMTLRRDDLHRSQEVTLP